MIISHNNSGYNINFSSRNKYIRTADDIGRLSKRAFPMMSATYVDDFYSCVSNDKNESRNKKARLISDMLHLKINAARRMTDDFEKKSGNTVPYFLDLNRIECLKLGNCKECAIIALSALAANNYTESQRVELYLKTQYINKNTNEVEYEAENPLDHSFVITTLNRKKLSEAKEKDLIVVDPWIGFADSFSGAKARFKQLYDEKSLKNITSYNRSMFRLKKLQSSNKPFNFNDYELKQSFVTEKADDMTSNDVNRLGEYIRSAYKGLVMKPQNS